jgi:predicted RNase H-like HicB family nuclease/uncharacterized damage-inducible protein DinB
VYLETGEEALSEGGYLAHVPALPGCVARGVTKEAALEKARQSIGDYLDLMRRYGQAAPSPDEPIELDVREIEVNSFEPDRPTLNDEDLAMFMQRFELSRRLLLDTLAQMPADALTWKAKPDEWAIANIVAHIAQGDFWYASRLDEGGLPELLGRIQTARQIVTERLRAVPAERRAHITVHQGEEWTPRKVARRVVEHELEHLDHIQQILVRYREAHS